jgi:hypothetical protein
MGTSLRARHRPSGAAIGAGGSGASRNMVPGGDREFPLAIRKRQSPKSRQRGLSNLRAVSIARTMCCSSVRRTTRSRSCVNISILCVQLKRSTRRFLVLNRDDKLARNRSAMKPFEWPPLSPMDEKRPLRREPDDHNFGSLMMLAVTAGSFLLGTWVATKALFLLLQESPIP